MILIYTSIRDRFITREVIHDNASGKVIAITARNDKTFSPESFVYIPALENCSDVALLFPYLMLAQSFAFHSSIALGEYA